MHWTIPKSFFASSTCYQLFSCVGKMIHTGYNRYVLVNILCFLIHFNTSALICAFSMTKQKNNKKNSNYIISIVKFISIEILYILPRFLLFWLSKVVRQLNQNVFMLLTFAYINVYIRIYKCNS